MGSPLLYVDREAARLWLVCNCTDSPPCGGAVGRGGAWRSAARRPGRSLLQLCAQCICIQSPRTPSCPPPPRHAAPEPYLVAARAYIAALFARVADEHLRVPPTDATCPLRSRPGGRHCRRRITCHLAHAPRPLSTTCPTPVPPTPID